MAAAAIIWLTGWVYVDPLVSVGIGLFIVPRTWRLMSNAVGVLLEGTPAAVNLAEMRAALAATSGVSDVHDLHVWALTSGVNALSVHVVADDAVDPRDILERVRRNPSEKLGMAHITVQVERPGAHCGAPHA
jgi:cobalt-zinc-cadmium efflux system protein